MAQTLISTPEVHRLLKAAGLTRARWRRGEGRTWNGGYRVYRTSEGETRINFWWANGYTPDPAPLGQQTCLDALRAAGLVCVAEGGIVRILGHNMGIDGPCDSAANAPPRVAAGPGAGEGEGR